MVDTVKEPFVHETPEPAESPVEKVSSSDSFNAESDSDVDSMTLLPHTPTRPERAINPSPQKDAIQTESARALLDSPSDAAKQNLQKLGSNLATFIETLTPDLQKKILGRSCTHGNSNSETLGARTSMKEVLTVLKKPWAEQGFVDRATCMAVLCDIGDAARDYPQDWDTAVWQAKKKSVMIPDLAEMIKVEKQVTPMQITPGRKKERSSKGGEPKELVISPVTAYSTGFTGKTGVVLQKGESLTFSEKAADGTLTLPAQLALTGEPIAAHSSGTTMSAMMGLHAAVAIGSQPGTKDENLLAGIQSHPDVVAMIVAYMREAGYHTFAETMIPVKLALGDHVLPKTELGQNKLGNLSQVATQEGADFLVA